MMVVGVCSDQRGGVSCRRRVLCATLLGVLLAISVPHYQHHLSSPRCIICSHSWPMARVKCPK